MEACELLTYTHLPPFLLSKCINQVTEMSAPEFSQQPVM